MSMTKNRRGVDLCQGGLSYRKKSMRPVTAAAFHYYCVGYFIVTQFANAAAFAPIQQWPTPVVYQRALTRTPRQQAGFLDDLLGGIFGDENNDNDDKKQIIETKNDNSASSRMSESIVQNMQEDEEEIPVEESDENEFRVGSLQAELDRRNNNNLESSPTSVVTQEEEEEEEFDGYAMRDVIYEKWGECFDVDFQRVDAFGMRELYLNVLPFRLGSRRFRHDTELDYLCHLQAIVEILIKYDQLGYVLMQIDETKKKPRGNTSPLVAVPLRLDLTPEQSNSILGYRD